MRTNTDGRRKVDGKSANFVAFYEIDGEEAFHNLSVSDYGHEHDVMVHGKWVLLKIVAQSP